MDTYQIGVSILLANNVAAALSALSSKLLGIHSQVDAINNSFGKWATAVGGVASIMGGVAIFGGLAKLAEHGSAVNHELELMKIQGMEFTEIQNAMKGSMDVTGKVMTTTLAENLKHVRELRYAFGNTGEALEFLGPVSKSNAILNALKGGGTDQVFELVKSLEQKGLATADSKAEFLSYVNTMTKATEASGGKVTPQMFMSTFKYGRTSMLGWDETFVGQYLPRLMQSMATGGGGGGSGSGGPGNALMNGFREIVSGVMSKPAAALFQELGLGGAEHAPGTTKSFTKVNEDLQKLFIHNPYEALQKYIMPALVEKYGKDQDTLIQKLGVLFPVRTFGAVGSEMGLQGRFMMGENSPFEKDAALARGAMPMNESYNELIKNDYPTVLAAFNAQFKSLLETLGQPLTAPGGPVLGFLSGLTDAMNSMAQFAGAHPDGLKYTLEALAGLAGGLVVAGLVALGVAIGGLVGVVGGVVAVTAAFGTLVAFNWDSIAGVGTAILKATGDAVLTAIAGIPGVFAGLGAAILSALKGAVSGIGGSLGQGLGGPAGDGKMFPDARKMNYNVVPPRGGGGGGSLRADVHIDGRRFASVMTKYQVVAASGPLQGSAYHDSTWGSPASDLAWSMG